MDPSGFWPPWQRLFDTGRRAERVAAAFLRGRGLVVLERNWRNPQDRREEIDLVCRDGPALVFAEVKGRPAGALVPGFHAVDRRKKAALRRAAGAYLSRARPLPRTFRFDVVEVEFGRGAPVVRHFENIPLFSKRERP